jgi:CRP-like cAMP-binding protein
MTHISLQPIGLFESVTEDVLSAISEISKVITHSRGELIFTEGDKAENLYILVEGEVAIRVRLTSRPESITVAVLNQSYESFGWSCVVAPYHYTASALCDAECTLFAIPGDKLINILRQEPISGFEVMRHITEVVSSRLRNSRVALLKTL